MNFSELVNKNRSCRAFDETRKISREELTQLIALARLSPSATNRQPLKYFLSCDEKTNAIIQPLTAWGGLLPELQLPPTGHCPTAFIVMCVDKNITPTVAAADRDLGIAAQTIMLGAVDMGLSGCMLGAVKFEQLHAALGLDDNLAIALVLALGKRDEEVKVVEATDSVKYYRDANGVHIVPKRSLNELIVNGGEQ